MSRLDVVVERLGPGVACVRLTGDLQHDHAHTLDMQLQRVEATATTLVIDLRGLSFLDPAGLGGLLAARRRAARAGRRLVLVRGQRNVDRVLMLAGLEQAFEVVTELDERIA
jgi:anti-sigma B factor antagonist